MIYIEQEKQLLIDGRSMNHNRPMVRKRTTAVEGNQALAELIKRAIEESGILSKEIARLCEIKPQAVSNWKTTGRIDKENLEKLALITNKPLTYFSTLKKQGLSAYGDYPTAEELHNKWLKVSEFWLHYGPLPNTSPVTAGEHNPDHAAKLEPEIINLALKIQELSLQRRYLIAELVEQLQQNGK